MLFHAVTEPGVSNEGAFDEAERLEFAEGQLRPAARLYASLARKSMGARMAGALLRLARVYRKLGDREQSNLAYARLAELNDIVTTGSLPAGLVAITS